MEVSSSTAAASNFGHEFNNQDGDNQNQPASSDGPSNNAMATPLVEMEGAESSFGATAMLEPAVPYGPVVCPDFYRHEMSSVSLCKDVHDPRAVHGSCGLSNLGNTCFMNSGLQSLMSCSPLIKFFSERFTLDEGSHSTLTGQFYILLCKLWCGQYSMVYPKKFKEFLGLYHSQFEDYRQHDCQEFLAFLLDTLHEQLNESIQPNNFSHLASSSASCLEAAPSSDTTKPPMCGMTGALSPPPLSTTAAPATVSCSDSELGRASTSACQMVDNFPHRVSDGSFEQSFNRLTESQSPAGGDKLVESSSSSSSSSCGYRHSPNRLDQNVNASSKSHDDYADSFVALDQISAVSSPKVNANVNLGEAGVSRVSDDDDSDFISSSGSSSLKRYTSRSHLDDVSSSDMTGGGGGGFPIKPLLKRVSTDTGVSASGLTFSSEDSNQSSVSVHSTDSEQSNTFKRLKIEASSLDNNVVSSRANSNCNSNSSSGKDLVVTSSSDYKADHHHHQRAGMKNGAGKDAEDEMMSGIERSDEAVVSSNLNPSVAGQVTNRAATANPMSPCHEDPMESSSPPPVTSERPGKQLHQLHSLEDFYKKETKTLNTNVLVASDHDMQDICDSEKFAKVDNCQRHASSREINLLDEVFDDEAKVEKVLISQTFALKETNLHPRPSSKLKTANQATTKPLGVLLNNSYEGERSAVSCQVLSKMDASHSKQEVMGVSPLKMANDVMPLSKLDEVEKNVQMQAYSKFNTTPPNSNIRADLTDSHAGAKPDDNMDEGDDDSSSIDEELDKSRSSVPPPHHAGSSVEECSSIPNCLRNCQPSEVAMANQAWQAYKARNNSVIVSTFQGQFRSTVVCSECSHVSVTYEPFMYLSLPIPHAMELQLCVTLMSPGKCPVRYLLNLMKTDKVGTAKRRLKETVVGVVGDVVMAEVLDSHIARILDDNILLKYVNMFNRKIYAFEVGTASSRAARLLGGAGDNDITRTLLNNEEDKPLSHSHHHLRDGHSMLRDDFCLVSTSRVDSGPDLLTSYHVDSHLSSQSPDSIHVNTPSSRDTMDLGFSDSEMCDDGSLSSPPPPPHPSHQQQQQGEGGLSPSSFFHQDDPTTIGLGPGTSSGDHYHPHHHDEDDDDVCQSTSDTKCIAAVTPWLHNKNMAMAAVATATATSSSSGFSSGGHCLSWQLVQEADGEDCDETASTVTTVVGSSSSVSGDDCLAPCSSTRFWVDRPAGHHSPTTTTSSKDGNDNESESNTSLSCNIEHATLDDKDSGGEGVDRCDSNTSNPRRDSGNLVDRAPPPITSSSGSGGGGDFTRRRGEDTTHHTHHHACLDGTDDALPLPCNHTTASTSRHCPSPESGVGIGGGGGRRTTDMYGGPPGPSEETPGSYFLQSPPRLYNMDFVCHTDPFGEEDKQAEMCEDAEAKCLADGWPGDDTASGGKMDDAARLHGVDIPCGSCHTDPVIPVMPAVANEPWRSCAICLEDLAVSQLLTHLSCDGVFCQSCLDMSVKHSPDVSFFCCPICLHPANVCEDFIPLPTSDTAKLQARILTVCVALRHLVVDNTGSSSLQCVGHPSVVEVTSVIGGDQLYALVDTAMGHTHLTYSVLLTDGQGLTCSRCSYSAHCTGCEIAREGEIILRPSDNLTVHFGETLTAEEVGELRFEYDDISLASLRSSEPTTIMDCFGAFTQSELLDEANPWYCPRCERNQCAKKTMTVWRYPDNLIIHLKRFVYQDLSSTKVDTKVVFPHEGMDVRGFLSGPSSPGLLYDLYSVICHFGGANSGHYTSFAHHPLTSQWFYYNDETVTQQAPSDNEYNSGYVLFYRRQGTAVDFSPPPFLPWMEDSSSPPPLLQHPSSSSSPSPSTSSMATFHHQGGNPPSVSSTSTPHLHHPNTTTTTDTTMTEHHHHKVKDNNKMALVLFVPPTSTTTAAPTTLTSSDPLTLSNPTTTSSTMESAEDDDDDYDCERRCSPSSDDGALPVHFGSALPDPDRLAEDDGEGEVTNVDVSSTAEDAREATMDDRLSPLAHAEPDSTFDFYW